MEFCKKGSLCEILNRGEKISKENFFLWRKQIADGVAKCEERKVVDQRLQKLKDQGSEAENKQEMKNSRSYPEKRNLSLSVFRKVTE